MGTLVNLPEFRGKALIKIPKNIPQADFLSGDFGKAVLREYQGRAILDYEGAKPLDVLSYKDGVVIGSNLFATVLINQVLRQEGLRTATPADLETVLRTGALNLMGNYEDSALVLRSESAPNRSLARNIYSQLQEKLGNLKRPTLPLMIPLAGLDLITDQNSDYGLAFKLREDSTVIYSIILNSENGCTFSSKDIDDKTGLPKTTGNGNRTLYTIKDGLSGLGLDRGLGLGSVWIDHDLANSNGNGRVVIVKSAEGASRNSKGEK